MKVYVLIRGWFGGDLDVPEGVFLTKEAAEEFERKLDQGFRHDFADIMEYELQGPQRLSEYLVQIRDRDN